eukprot:15471965-Alexandrium_andersonii.AAC.1
MTPNHPDEAFWRGIRGRSRDRAIQVLNASSNSALSRIIRSRTYSGIWPSGPRARKCPKVPERARKFPK